MQWIANAALLAASSLLLASPVMARTFFVGSYGGEILTVSLDANTTALAVTASTNASAPSPSWQEVAHNGTVLYTVEEAAHADPSKGAVSSYRILPGGALEKIASATGLRGPVSLGVSPSGTTIFTANYDTSGVSAYATDRTGALTHLQDWTYNLTAPGAIPERQDAPHPHQALFDPTGRFVVIPDLGADLLRVFSVHREHTFLERTPIATSPGRGPRHGLFFPPTGTPRFYYLVAELACTVSVYAVRYAGAELVLDEVQVVSTLSANETATRPPPPPPLSTPSAAELAIDPRGTVLYASNRNDSAFANSHSIVAFAIHPVSGRLAFLERFPSAVLTPRHISLDPTGEFLVAEGQDSANLVVFRRNHTGLVSTVAAAELGVPGGAVCVQWLD